MHDNFTRNWRTQNSRSQSASKPLWLIRLFCRTYYPNFLIFTIVCILFNSPCFANTNEFRTRLHQSLSDNGITQNDVKSEIEFGKEVAARILAIETLNTDSKLSKYVNLVGTSLAIHSQRIEITYHFAVLDSNALNAYSAPGGYIFITKALIDLAQDESELAGILAHEIAHITQRHIVNDLNIRGAVNDELSSFARFIGATSSTTRVALSQAVDEAIKYLFETGYQKEQEIEADKIATLLLATTGYDPTALQRILHRIDNASQQVKSITHPTFDKRYAGLQTLINEENLNSSIFKQGKLRFLSFIKD